jgi:hypothetical protein
MFRQKTFLFVMVFAAILASAGIAFAAVESLTFNQTAIVSPGKTMLTVSGTVTCSPGQSIMYLNVHAFQQRGGRETVGYGSAVNYNIYSYPPDPIVACTGNPMYWQASVNNGNPMTGLWQSGPVNVRATVQVCTLMIDPWSEMPIDCEYGTYENLVMDARLHAN